MVNYKKMDDKDFVFIKKPLDEKGREIIQRIFEKPKDFKFFKKEEKGN